MSAAHAVHSTPTAGPVLYVAFELGWGTWKMAFTIGAGQSPRIRTVPARLTSCVLHEIKKAKLRFGLPANAPVVSCYEAGRDGFWLHRFLLHQGIQNIVVDSASIEVSRRSAERNRIASMPSSWCRCSFDGTTVNGKCGAWSMFPPSLMKMDGSFIAN